MIIHFIPYFNWVRLDTKKMSAVGLKVKADFYSQEDQLRQFLWFKENLEKFTKFFKPIIQKL